MDCVVVDDVATFVAVVVVVVVVAAVAAVAAVVDTDINLFANKFCVEEPLIIGLLLIYSSYVYLSKFRIEGPITGLLLIYSSYASKSPTPGALPSK